MDKDFADFSKRDIWEKDDVFPKMQCIRPLGGKNGAPVSEPNLSWLYYFYTPEKCEKVHFLSDTDCRAGRDRTEPRRAPLRRSPLEGQKPSFLASGCQILQEKVAKTTKNKKNKNTQKKTVWGSMTFSKKTKLLVRADRPEFPNRPLEIWIQVRSGSPSCRSGPLGPVSFRYDPASSRRGRKTPSENRIRLR